MFKGLGFKVFNFINQKSRDSDNTWHRGFLKRAALTRGIQDTVSLKIQKYKSYLHWALKPVDTTYIGLVGSLGCGLHRAKYRRALERSLNSMCYGLRLQSVLILDLQFPV